MQFDFILNPSDQEIADPDQATTNTDQDMNVADVEMADADEDEEDADSDETGDPAHTPPPNNPPNLARMSPALQHRLTQLPPDLAESIDQMESIQRTSLP